MGQKRLKLYLIDYEVHTKSGEGRRSCDVCIYKIMATKQLGWCQQNQDAIIKKANKLYLMIKSGKASGILRKRCCDFEKLEAVLRKWLETKEH